ncbi:hypothetical protein BASA50_008611 [Batrachochytrium salamandrivorans]|uniref:FAS1 domain-containing protein n=1 Tax=Batrachochytrium salamandrivorans TaxID=1357716 RepID=A0ABQ8F6X9_9FUNG|nr:hypothetical protein BASA62_006523 [Batrachochytrium salamandrivorans]KAH6576535.1 hypothetical protein BASA60_004483 [Batrachochytrium salamandrivorans]KAH6591638.1 hypothetical protein BASA50_008611 [Batrachochytrium salamandrivorans]KAH6598188.1 hypothetical protein BASA61_002935 [Batrachochytrium salamandrivorans]KAJ1332648.1 hypothetical protein BSLG_008277 [Batrachochytrium salamandrivorans]
MMYLLSKLLFALALSTLTAGISIPAESYDSVLDSGSALQSQTPIMVVDTHANQVGISVGKFNPKPSEKISLVSEILNIFELVSRKETLSTVAILLLERDALVMELTSKDANLTVFTPDNEAFKRMRYPPPSDVMTNILLYHMVSGKTLLSGFKNMMLLDTAYKPEALNGLSQKIRVFVDDGGRVFLNQVPRILESDLIASNGVVHTVSQIILPPPNALNIISHNPLEFAVFMLALRHSGQDDIVRNTHALTVFAPTNQAFKDLGWLRLRYLFSEQGRHSLSQLLLYHFSVDMVYSTNMVIGDSTLTTMLDGKYLYTSPERSEDGSHNDIKINGESYVIEADGLADNGVVHTIDKVLLPFDWTAIDEIVNDWKLGIPFSSEDTSLFLSIFLESS